MWHGHLARDVDGGQECPPHRLFLHHNRALAFDQQLINDGHILVAHADAAHRFFAAYRGGIDGAVDAIAVLADGAAVDAVQADPVFTQRIFRIVGGDDAFAARTVIGRVLQFSGRSPTADRR
jgi:hypothetical protein